jgi:hypothetical protein
LAGELGLAIAQALVREGAIVPDEDGFRLCDGAHAILLRAGVDTKQVFSDPHAHVRCCIDWTERRHHISGPLGIALLKALLDARVVRRRSESRALEVTDEGREFLRAVLGIDLSTSQRLAG